MKSSHQGIPRRSMVSRDMVILCAATLLDSQLFMINAPVTLK